MNCEECKEKMSEYVEGELAADVAGQVGMHVGTCENCRKDLAALKRVLSAVSELPAHAPGTETILKISQAIHESQAPQKKLESGPIMDIDELAAFIRVDKARINDYLGEIPSFEMSGQLLFRKESVEEWARKREFYVGIETKQISETQSTKEMYIDLDALSDEVVPPAGTSVQQESRPGGEKCKAQTQKWN